ncbi:hypothetical protein BH10BAC2_BH10BAC2_11110 [soil metagenome]
MLKQNHLYKSRFESRDEAHLPFVPQGDAANMCDARNDAFCTNAGIKKLFLLNAFCGQGVYNLLILS